MVVTSGDGGGRHSDRRRWFRPSFEKCPSLQFDREQPRFPGPRAVVRPLIRFGSNGETEVNRPAPAVASFLAVLAIVSWNNSPWLPARQTQSASRILSQRRPLAKRQSPFRPGRDFPADWYALPGHRMDRKGRHSASRDTLSLCQGKPRSSQRSWRADPVNAWKPRHRQPLTSGSYLPSR